MQTKHPTDNDHTVVICKIREKFPIFGPPRLVKCDPSVLPKCCNAGKKWSKMTNSAHQNRQHGIFFWSSSFIKYLFVRNSENMWIFLLELQFSIANAQGNTANYDLQPPILKPRLRGWQKINQDDEFCTPKPRTQEIFVVFIGNYFFSKK
jgi:hypothetical protein